MLDVAYGISVDPMGNVYITGDTRGSLGGPHAALDDAFVAKFNSDGALLWTQQFGRNLDENATGIALDALGNVYISGTTSGNGIDAFLVKLSPPGLPLAGDINADGKVDLRDFYVLKQNFGAGDATRAMGDLNGDMAVDMADFNVLKENFGTTHSAAVPEPRKSVCNEALKIRFQSRVSLRFLTCLSWQFFALASCQFIEACFP